MDINARLRMISETDYVYLLIRTNTDSWGISEVETIKKKYYCNIKDSEDSTPINSMGGKQVIPTYSITFNGKVSVFVGDYVEVDGSKKIVLNKKTKKDLLGNVLITKITV